LVDTARRIIDSALASGRTVLLEDEAKAICQEYDISTPTSQLAHDPQEAVKIAERIGYPVVMKISSIDISHKSDVGGVAIGLDSASKVHAAFDGLIKNALHFKADASITGVLVEKQAPQGVEMIVGARKDPQFGHIIIVGLGGVSVELFKDFSARLVPFSEREALKMIREMKAYQLLAGWRGKSPMDIAALAKIIMSVSKLVTEYPSVEELDLNPVAVYENGAIVLDSRISFDRTFQSNLITETR